MMMMEKQVTVRCRAEDKQIVSDQLDAAISQFQDLLEAATGMKSSYFLCELLYQLKRMNMVMSERLEFVLRALWPSIRNSCLLHLLRMSKMQRTQSCDLHPGMICLFCLLLFSFYQLRWSVHDR